MTGLPHRGALTAPHAAAVRGLAAAAHAHDGIEALGEQTLLDLTTADERVVHVLAPAAGTSDRLLGYAQVDLRADPPSAEVVVHPDARRAGHGRRLVAAVRELAAQAAAPAVAIWAHGNLEGARALAASAGLTVHRELWRMSRPLAGDEPEPPLPEGVRARSFVVGQDEAAVLEVNARAFDWHPEQGRMSLADLRARQGEPWFSADDLVLLERDDTLLAFVWLKVEPGSAEGELYVLAVDPRAQGQGLGRHLTAVTLARLAAAGLRRAVLYTEADNAAAVGTYTAAGFARDRADVQYR